jgi:hypothetical protein
VAQIPERIEQVAGFVSRTQRIRRRLSYSAKQPSEPEAERQRRYVHHHEQPHEIKALPGFAGFRRVSHLSLGTHLPVTQHMGYLHHLDWHHLDHVE